MSLNLLNVFDPYLLALIFFIFLLHWPPVRTSAAVFGFLIIYICWRYFLRAKAARSLARFFAGTEEMEEMEEILVLPSLQHIFFWDFIVKTKAAIYVGQISAFQETLTIRAELSKEDASFLTKIAEQTNLGQFFSAFTPFSHFQEDGDDFSQAKIVRIYDLRYYFAEGFAYSATIIFTPDGQPSHSYISAYGKKIKMSCF